jgi:hypothetical protein
MHQQWPSPASQEDNHNRVSDMIIVQFKLRYGYYRRLLRQVVTYKSKCPEARIRTSSK